MKRYSDYFHEKMKYYSIIEHGYAIQTFIKRAKHQYVEKARKADLDEAQEHVTALQQLVDTLRDV